MIRLVLWLWAGWQALRPVEGQPCPWCGRTGAGEPRALEREMAALRREFVAMGSAVNRPDDDPPAASPVRS